MIRLRTFSFLLLWMGGLAAQVRFDASRWAWRAAVEVPGGASPAAFAAFRLDAAAYRYGGPALASLRIVAPNGSEAPFTVRYATPVSSDPDALRPRMINRVQTAQGAMQFELDFGPGRTAHNALRFEWSEQNFRRTLRIESSAGHAQWDLVKEAVLLDFHQDGLAYRTRQISYPESTRRYLRLTLSGWIDPSTLTAVDSVRTPAARSEWTELAAPKLRPSPAATAEGKGDTAYEFDLEFGAPAPLRLEVSADGDDFVRSVEFQSRRGQQRWYTVCSGTIARAGGESSSVVDCSSPLEGTLRMLVRNRDNAPVRLTGLRVLHPARVVTFRSAATGTYTIYAGNPAAQPPQYDIDDVLARIPSTDPPEVRLAVWHPNPGYKAPPVPLSERARGWVAPLLAAVVAAVGGAAFLLLRKAK